MAFLRRKGNAFYLVHNVRKGGRIRQLHLAKLGERPRITDDVVRQVTRSYPFVDVNWRELREQMNTARPRPARVSATARPIPLVPPVISATCCPLSAIPRTPS